MTALNIVIVNAETGEEEHVHVPDNDYHLITTGTCELESAHAERGGTVHVLRIVGRVRVP